MILHSLLVKETTLCYVCIYMYLYEIHDKEIKISFQVLRTCVNIHLHSLAWRELTLTAMWNKFWSQIFCLGHLGFLVSCLVYLYVIISIYIFFWYGFSSSFPKSAQWFLRARALVYSRNRRRKYNLFSTQNFMSPIFS